MAIERLGLSWYGADSTDSGNIVVGAGTQSDSVPYVKFTTKVFKSSYEEGGTEHVTCEQKYVDLAVTWQAVRRGDSAVNGYDGGWPVDQGGGTKWWWRRFKVTDSDIEHVEGDGGVQWAISLDFVSQDTSTYGTSIMTSLVQGGDMSFAGRRYDEIMLLVKVKTWYAEEGWSEIQDDPISGLVSSPRADETVFIGYRPTYTCTGASLGKDGLRLTYSSPAWSRATDRWCVEELAQGGESLVRQDAKPWGTVARAGAIVIPYSSLTRVPDTTQITGRVRFNACWRPSDLSFAAMGVSQVPSGGSARTPVLSLSSSGGNVTAIATDPGGQGLALETVTIKVRGSSLSVDQATVTPGTPVTFMAFPEGSVTVQAVGHAANGSSSPRATASVSVSGGGGSARIVPADGSFPSIDMRFNLRLTWSDSPESVTEKLAGRARESTWYGEGGSASCSASFDIVDSDGTKVPRQRESDVRALAYCGPCLLLTPATGRVLVSVGTVSVSNENEGRFRVKNCSLEMTEVA